MLVYNYQELDIRGPGFFRWLYGSGFFVVFHSYIGRFSVIVIIFIVGDAFLTFFIVMRDIWHFGPR